jgi:hypothetical protein
LYHTQCAAAAAPLPVAAYRSIGREPLSLGQNKSSIHAQMVGRHTLFVTPVLCSVCWVSCGCPCLPSAVRGEVGWLPRPARFDRYLQFKGELKVSSYTIDELIARWKREELTVEQVIGQILLLLKEQDRRLREATLYTHTRREQ